MGLPRCCIIIPLSTKAGATTQRQAPMLTKVKPWLLAAAIVGGFAGVVLHAALQVAGGPTYLQNQTVGMWGALVVAVFAAQALDDLKKPLYRISKHRMWQLVYNIVILLAATIAFLCYAVGRRGQGAGWMIALVFIQLINLHTLKDRPATEGGLPVRGLNNLDKEVEPPRPVVRQRSSCLSLCCRSCNVCFLAFMLLVMALLISGAQILARGPTKFPARGKMVEITLADGSGRKHQVHVRCDGPKNASFPVILMESDGSHGMLDFVALQMQFTANGRRSCIWDKPGLGYSDVRYAKRDDAEQFLPPLIDALGEQPPYILLGWGGGGPTVYQYATTAPQNVHSLVFLEAYPNDVEFLVEQRLNNLTNDATAAKRSVDLTGRRVLMGIINFIGIPLGLMPIIIPPANTTPPSLGAEVQWYMLADKTWTNQQFYLKESAAASMFAPSVFEQHALAPHIPIHTIAQVWSDDQARRIQCTSTDTSTDCANKVRRNQLYLDYKLGLLQYSGNRSASVMVNCTMDECTQATLVWWMPQYTATAVEHIYAGVSL